MDGAPKGTGPLTMDYTNMDYVSVPAFRQVAGDEILYFAGIEGVQVESAVNGEFDHIIIIDVHQDGAFNPRRLYPPWHQCSAVPPGG